MPKATEVTVDVLENNNHLKLSVKDNGIGFNPDAPSMGLGLASIRERAETVGGKVSILSTPGEGTTVKITVAFESDERV